MILSAHHRSHRGGVEPSERKPRWRGRDLSKARLGRGETHRTRRMVCAPSRSGGRQADCSKGVAIQPSGLRRDVAVPSWASGFGHLSFARSRTRSRPIVWNGVALVFGRVGRGGRLESRLRPDARSQSGSVLDLPDLLYNSYKLVRCSPVWGTNQFKRDHDTSLHHRRRREKASAAVQKDEYQPQD